MKKTRSRETPTQSISYITETTIICDECKKESFDDGEIKFGGCIHGSWLVVYKNIALPYQIMGIQTNWDFCSEECMIKNFTKEKK